MIRAPRIPRLRAPRSTVADALLLAAAAAVLYALLAVAPREFRRLSPSVVIDLSPAALPRYSLLSLLRMVAAYAVSLSFTLVAGYAAARTPALGRWIVPSLDILQSIPVLSFLPAVLLAMIALFPRRTIGLEIGSVLLIFTGMVWNMAFSFYHSLLTIPEELMEAARAFRLSWWQRFTALELPAAAIGLVWNSMMSWAGGWFFLMATEAFTLGSQSFTLPGLGSYLAVAANRENFGAIAWGLGALILLIVALDQLIWRPLIAWSDRFKIELSEDPSASSSWVLDLLQHSAVLPWLRRQMGRAFPAGAGSARPVPARPRGPAPAAKARGRFPVGWGAAGATGAAVLAAAWGAASLVRLVWALPAAQWGEIAAGTGLTLLRVGAALVLSVAWAVPAGVAIGLRPGLARVAQPLAQIAASVPATAVFPVLLLLLLRAGGGLSLASILLMLLGTQWYVLFNVIAGAIALPHDMQEAARLMKLRGWMRWQTLIIPAIFPHLVTGGIAAQGGAWNASIVSEYVVFGGRTLQTLGLGALISEAAANGNYPLLAASTVAMGAVVVAINRLGWRRAAHLAEERYHV